MDRPIVTLPLALQRVTRIDWDIDWREQSAGTGTGGRRNVLLGALPRWVGTVPAFVRGADLGAWRALRLAAMGLTGIYRVRMFDPGVSPIGCAPGVPFDDDTLFDDGAGWDDFPIVPCPSGAARGATQVVLDESDAPRPIAVGQILSHGDWPFSVLSRADLGGGLVRLDVAMPLRAAIPAGDPVELMGAGLFELVERGAGLTYGPGRTAFPELRLQEWLR